MLLPWRMRSGARVADRDLQRTTTRRRGVDVRMPDSMTDEQRGPWSSATANVLCERDGAIKCAALGVPGVLLVMVEWLTRFTVRVTTTTVADMDLDAEVLASVESVVPLGIKVQELQPPVRRGIGVRRQPGG